MKYTRKPSTLILRRLQQLNADDRGVILVAISMGWFLSIGVRNIFPVLIPYMRSSFSMSLTASGLLLTFLWLAYAVGQFPGGILVDRIGGRNILVLSTATSLFTIVILIGAFSVWMLFLSTVLFGFATALYGPARSTVLYDIYDENDRLAIGITLAAGNVGNAILPVIAGLFAAYLVWQTGFGFVIPLFIISTLTIWCKLPKQANPDVEDDQAATGPLETLRNVVDAVLQPKILIITSILLMNTFILQGFTGFYPTYLIEMKGLSPTLAPILFVLFFTADILVQPLSGASNDTFSPSLTIAAFLGCIIVGLFSLPFLSSDPYLIAVTILLSSLMGTSPTATSQLVHLLPDEIKGSGLGLLRTLYMFIASTGSIFIGYFADIDYFDEAFLLLSVIGFIAFSLAIVYYWFYEDN